MSQCLWNVKNMVAALKDLDWTGRIYTRIQLFLNFSSIPNQTRTATETDDGLDRHYRETRIKDPITAYTDMHPGSALQLSTNFVQIVAVNVFQKAYTIAIGGYFEFSLTLCLPQLRISIVSLHNLSRPKVSLNRFYLTTVVCIRNNT